MGRRDGPARRHLPCGALQRPWARRLVDPAAGLATVHRHGDATGQALEAGAIDRLGEIRVPTRVVVGDLDSSDIHDVAERIVAQAPDATIATIPGAAHTLNLEQAHAWTRELQASLQVLDAGRTRV